MYTPLSQAQDTFLDKAVELIKSNEVCPIFQVSSLTGQGLNELTKFIHKLKCWTHQLNLIGDFNDPVEFDIHENFWV